MRLKCVRECPEIHLKLKSREIAFSHNLFLRCSIILKCCTWHGSDTAVLCATFRNGGATYMNVMNEIVQDLSLR